MIHPIKVLIADQQCLTRKGLVSLLNIPEISVEAEVDNRDDLFVKLIEIQPQVVIFDYFNTEQFGLEDIQVIRQFAPASNILIISDDHNKATIFKTIDLGIHSFLTKSCDEKEIIDAVFATAKAEKFFCNKVLNLILEKHFPKEDNCDPSILTPRELEIIKLVAQGIPTRELAGQLHVSPHTIYTHRKNIMKKLNVNSASELILYAVNEGIV